MVAIAVMLTCIGFNVVRAQSQWVRQESGTTNSLYGVDFADANLGIAVGAAGTILRTTDGGVTWKVVDGGVQADLLKVDLVDALNATIVGDGGTILRSTNGGVSWTQQDSRHYGSFWGLYFIGHDTGIVVGSVQPLSLGPSLIVRTTNGGATWETVDSATLRSLQGVTFIDEHIGIAVGDGNGGAFLRTINGGVTWERREISSDRAFFNVAFAGRDTGYAVGNNQIMKSIDGGVNWFLARDLSVLPPVYDVRLRSATQATVVGFFGIIESTVDGGLRWQREDSAGSYSLFSIRFPDDGHAVAVGSDGVILRKTEISEAPGETDTWAASPLTVESVHPQPAQDEVAIDITMMKTCHVLATIEDVLGRSITTLLDADMQAGHHTLRWNTADAANGVYYCRIQLTHDADSRSTTQGIMVTR